MARADRVLDRFSFGGRVPGGVGVVLAATIATSLVTALASRHVLPLFELGSLVAERVFAGEVWRLLAWSVIEPSPLSLLFICLMLWWFGRELAERWGSRRFLAVYFGVALVAAIGTCLIALVDRRLLEQAYVGSWPLAEAIAIAWGLSFPERVIRIYFVLPLRGYVLAWLTVAITVVYAIYAGWDRYVPNLLAEGAMLGWMYRAPAVSRLAGWRRARAASARAARARRKGEQRLATVHVLRAIEAKDDDLPALPDDVQGTLDRILADAGRDARKKKDDGGPR
jgi:membrane associated rhomboid family serine protease